MKWAWWVAAVLLTPLPARAERITLMGDSQAFLIKEELGRTGAKRIVRLTPPDLERARPGLECFNRMLAEHQQQTYDGRSIQGMRFWEDRLHLDQPSQLKWADWVWSKRGERTPVGQTKPRD